MRKKILSIAVLAVIVSISSCGSSSSFESDVKKMADYRCKEKQLMAKDPTDEKAKKEMGNLKKEMDTYTEKMKKKYEDKKDDSAMNAKAEKIMDEEMAKCK